jgi:hypothetical protein
MQKVEIDYSNTIIYKITCNDPNVNDVYVGHTTNFVQRKHAHKQSCINEKSSNNKSKLYEMIRANGGWINWNMEIIHFCNCKNHYEARIKEQEYFVLLKATLNSIEPMPPKKTILVKSSPTPCANAYGDQTITQCTVDTNKIQSTSDISTNNTKKNIKKPRCEMCDFNCSKIGDWKRHIITSKHIHNNELITQITSTTSTSKKYICSCGKEYKYQSGLCCHKKKCTYKINENNTLIEENDDDKSPTNNNDSLIIELLKQNQDFKHLMIEQNTYMMEQTKQMMELVKNTMNNNNSFNSRLRSSLAPKRLRLHVAPNK